MHNYISSSMLPTDTLMEEAPEAVKTAREAAKRAMEGIDKGNLESLKGLKKTLKGLDKGFTKWADELETKRGHKKLKFQVEHSRSELQTLLGTVDSKIHVLKEVAKMKPISPEAMRDGKVSFMGQNYLRVLYHMKDGSTPEGSVREDSSLQCTSTIAIGEKPRFKDNQGNEVSSTYPVTAIHVQGETAFITLGPDLENHVLAIYLKKTE